MYYRRCIGVFLIFLGFSVINAGFVDAKAPTAFGQVLDILMDEREVDRDRRLLVAQNLEGVCSEIGNKIPSLSPREHDWINSEIRAERLWSLYSTKEFAKRQIKDAMLACQQNANMVIHTISANQIVEAYYWIRILDVLSNWTLKDHIQTLSEDRDLQITYQDVSTIKLLDTLVNLIIKKILTPLVGRIVL